VLLVDDVDVEVVWHPQASEAMERIKTSATGLVNVCTCLIV
jgi:hypothetical protein